MISYQISRLRNYTVFIISMIIKYRKTLKMLAYATFTRGSVWAHVFTFHYHVAASGCTSSPPLTVITRALADLAWRATWGSGLACEAACENRSVVLFLNALKVTARAGVHTRILRCGCNKGGVTEQRVGLVPF